MNRKNCFGFYLGSVILSVKWQKHFLKEKKDEKNFIHFSFFKISKLEDKAFYFTSESFGKKFFPKNSKSSFFFT